MPKVRVAALATALVLSLASVGERGTRPLPQQARPGSILSAPSAFSTATPIQHLVVIYQENESFDHYFGLYPRAMNPPGEPAFHPAPATTHPNGLTTALVTHNPNGVNPRRLTRAQLFPCSNDHSYTGEQQAFDRGRMDRFVHPAAPGCTYGSTMDYYDGNTVTALWNYAHRFSMSDNSHDATYVPTLLGHLNLAAGQTHGAVVTGGTTGAVVNGTLIGNANAQYEDCGPATGPKVAMSGRNVGDLLSSARVSWDTSQRAFGPRRATRTAPPSATRRTAIWPDTPTVTTSPGRGPNRSSSGRRRRTRTTCRRVPRQRSATPGLPIISTT
jgi:phospholipase C